MILSSLHISNLQLLSFTLFIFVTAVIARHYKLQLSKDLIIGSIRTYIQLLIMGLALVYIFKYSNPFLSLVVYIWMIFWAARIISKRITAAPFPIFKPTFLCMLVTYLSINIICVGIFLQADPWYTPQLFITIGGMIIGNSMNAMAISLERLFSDTINRRKEIEQKLLFGFTSKAAIQETVRDAIKAGVSPSINNLAGVGLVFIPGMMTGQILGGEDPINAAKYQILIMLMVCSSTALGCMLTVQFMAKKLFNEKSQLIDKPTNPSNDHDA